MVDLAHMEEREDGVYLGVRVQPKASRNAVRVEADGRVRVALTAPPVEGAANKALVAAMAKALGLPPRAVALVRGTQSREKVLRIQGLRKDEVGVKLLAL